MKKTIDHFLTQRFEVIGDYPNSRYDVGEVFWAYTEMDESFYLAYPNLFRKLNWWENRKEEDMPEYLKIDYNSNGSFKYYKIEKWLHDNKVGKINDLQVCSLNIWPPEKTFQPCSEEEYLLNQK